MFVMDAAVDTPKLSPPSKVAALLRATDAILGFINETSSVETAGAAVKPFKLSEHRSEANLRRQSAPAPTLKPSLVPRQSGSKSEKAREVHKDVGKQEAQGHGSKCTQRSPHRQKPSTGRADIERSADVLVTRALDGARGTHVRDGRKSGTVAVRRNGANQERVRNDRSDAGSETAKGARRDLRRSSNKVQPATDAPQGRQSQSPRTKTWKRPGQSGRSQSTSALRTETSRPLPNTH